MAWHFVFFIMCCCGRQPTAVSQARDVWLRESTIISVSLFPFSIKNKREGKRRQRLVWAWKSPTFIKVCPTTIQQLISFFRRIYRKLWKKIFVIFVESYPHIHRAAHRHLIASIRVAKRAEGGKRGTHRRPLGLISIYVRGRWFPTHIWYKKEHTLFKDLRNRH